MHVLSFPPRSRRDRDTRIASKSSAPHELPRASTLGQSQEKNDGPTILAGPSLLTRPVPPLGTKERGTIISGSDQDPQLLPSQAGAQQAGVQHAGTGQQTVTGTCLHTTRGTHRVTVYGTFLQTHLVQWIVLV